MKYNVARERFRFFMEQDKLAKEYRKAGMTEEQIKAMFDYDYELLKKDRIFKIHNDFIDFGAVENGVPEEQGFSPAEYPDRFSHTLEDYAVRDRYGWIEEVENPELYGELKKLPRKDMELITMHIMEGFTLTEIAKKRGVSLQAVSRKLKKLKNFLKNFC